MSIRKRLFLFVVFTTLLLSLTAGVLHIGGPLVLGAFRRSLDVMTVLNALRTYHASLIRERTSLNRYLLVGDAQELLGFEESRRLARRDLAGLATIARRQGMPWMDEMVAQAEATDQVAESILRSYRRGQRAEAIDHATSDFLPAFQTLLDFAEDTEGKLSQESLTLFEAIRALTNRASLVVISILGFGLVVNILLFISLYRAVMRPIGMLQKGAEAFGRGQWDHRIALTKPGELASLAASFNNMAENVRQLQLQAVHMDRMSAVGQLAGGVAHELNNPLTAVLGQAQIVLMRMEEAHPLHAHVKKVEAAAIRCKKIVRGLLDFSRPTQSNFEVIDVNDIVLSTMDLCEADLKKSKVLVDRKLAPQLPRVRGNPSELQQVFLNLINNAIQAMPQGGRLVLETRFHSEELTIPDRRKDGTSSRAEGPWVDVGFSDSGMGIAREHLVRVFEPFFTTKEIGEGTGLGLAISQGIIRKHGGQMTAESAGMSKGSAFHVFLPVSRGGEARP